jgi:hypothetical protein
MWFLAIFLLFNALKRGDKKIASQRHRSIENTERLLYACDSFFYSRRLRPSEKEPV